MYETIMDLPLFKGISHDHVSQFVERTHLNFLNFADGERVASAGRQVQTLTYIIRGKVRASIPLLEGRAKISFTQGQGSVIGANHLFGLNRTLPCDVDAIGSCSAIEISKEQYLALLPTDPIYMVNYLNYLSYHAQRGIKTIQALDASNPLSAAAAWVGGLVALRSTDIVIDLPIEMCEAVASSPAYIQAADRDICRLKGNTLEVIDRERFLEAAGLE